jgi:hypothetical protein
MRRSCSICHGGRVVHRLPLLFSKNVVISHSEVSRAWKEFIRPLLLLLVGFAVGYSLAHYEPFFIFDRWGHRLYGTVDERACAAILKITADNGLKPDEAFDAEPTHQVIMEDRVTVFAWFTPGTIDEKDQNAVSLVVSDPVKSAYEAADYLVSLGYKATVDKPVKTPKEDVLVRLRTNALVNCDLIFRRHILLMGGKPSARQIPVIK